MTNEEATTLLNAVADEVLDWAGAGDEGARDVVNLIVNVFAERLAEPDVSIDEVIDANYDADPETVRDWCQR